MTKRIKLPYKMLIYDTETPLLKAWTFHLGEQLIRHDKLDAAFNEFKIICICAKWYGSKEVMVFQGDNAVEEFDKLARQADVCIGKNSDNFDVKRINTVRMMQGLIPYPEWMETSDDLEKQMRKYFAFPSQSLDYISNIFGYGGKTKMEVSDWIKIANYYQASEITHKGNINDNLSYILYKQSCKEVFEGGQKALVKMIKYCCKDVRDTEAALVKVLPYIKLKRNASKEGKGCILCGSTNLRPTKIVVVGKTKYQQWECLDHKGYAGRCTWYYNQNSHCKKYNKMG